MTPPTVSREIAPPGRVYGQHIAGPVPTRYRLACEGCGTEGGSMNFVSMADRLVPVCPSCMIVYLMRGEVEA